MSTTHSSQVGGAMGGFNKVLVTIGKTVGGVVGTLYQAGRDTIDMVIRNILPFMAFIAMLIGIINETGLGDWLAHLIEPLAGSLLGLLVISIFCCHPDPVAGARPRCRHRAGRRRAARHPDRRGRHPAAVRPAGPVRHRPPGRLRLHPRGPGPRVRRRPETSRSACRPCWSRGCSPGPLSVLIAYFASFGLYTTSN